MKDKDFLFMSRCFQLAMNGLGTTFPNPLVGSVLVDSDNNIIGEGWHHKAGEPHAEVIAFKNAEGNGGKINFSKCTLYVNLEPCSHHGKTPPCADLLVKRGIGRVVIANVDPHNKVAGRGIQRLRDAGIEVKTGILEEAGEEVNKRFFWFQRKQQPYIILKWAESADGYLAPMAQEAGKPVWITNAQTRQLVHKLRAEEHAILVGSGTVRKDNPSLTVRDWKGINPIRIVLDRNLKLDQDSKVFDEKAKTIHLDADLNDLALTLECLHQEDIQSLIVEGGAATLQAFIDQGFYNEIQQFMSTTRFLRDGLKAPAIPINVELIDRQSLYGNDLLKTYIKR